MKYLLLIVLLIVPSFSFAASSATTPTKAQQIAAIEALLIQLEAELQAELAAAPVPVATSTPLAPVQVSVGTPTAYTGPQNAIYGIPVTITNNTGSSIYIPAVVSTDPTHPGFGFSFVPPDGGKPYTNGYEAYVNCAPEGYLLGATGYAQACVVPANQSATENLNITTRAMDTSGTYAVSVMNISYATSPSTPSLTVLPFPTNQTNFIQE